MLLLWSTTTEVHRFCIHWCIRISHKTQHFISNVVGSILCSFFFKRKTWFCVWVFAQRAATHRQFVCHKLDLRRIALPSLRYLCVLSNILSLHSKYMLCLQSVPLSISMDCIAVYFLSFFQYPHYIAVIVRSFSWTRFGLHSHVSAEPQHDYDNNSNDSKLRCVLCV